MRIDDALKDYLAGPRPHRLEIGTGESGKPGWLSTDVQPGLGPDGRRSIGLDATKPFAIPADSFDFVYSEHMIEHVSFDDGQTMLKECQRVLRPGGTLRIATPSIYFLMRVISDKRTRLEADYREWSVKYWAPTAPAVTNAIFLNNFMRNWGHTFVYDPETLKLAFQLAGFVNIRECKFGDSKHPEFKGLENSGRLPPGFLELETMIVEGEKPSAVSDVQVSMDKPLSGETPRQTSRLRRLLGRRR